MRVVDKDIVVMPEHAMMAVRVSDSDACMKLSAIPGLHAAADDDGMTWLMPWTEESCRLLRNIGVDNVVKAAPFMLADHPLVEGRYAPMEHQLLTGAFMTLYDRSYVLSDPRTGKTGAVILGMDYMQRTHAATGGFLVITTLTTMDSVWRRSIQATVPDARIVMVHGKNREQALEEPADFYITNYDSCRLSRYSFIAAVKEGRIGGVVIDELTHVGNSTSGRSSAINDICSIARRCYGLTGSPAENIEHVFGMARVVNKDALPCKTKTAWLGLTTYQYGPEPYMRRPNAAAPDLVFKAMQPAIRFNKGDILDLPPVVTQDRVCDMSMEQTRMLKQFRRDAVALARSGVVITAANGGALYNKIMQVSQGFCMNNEGEPIQLDASPRHQTILDIIGETSNKVVIFNSYREGLRRLKQIITKAGISADIIDGSVTGAERSRILSAFSELNDPHVLICHPTTTAYGVELAAADTMVFDGPPPLGGFIYAQALERLSSAKQKSNKISIIRVMSSKEEKKYFNSLDNGREMGNFVSALFEEYKKGA